MNWRRVPWRLLILPIAGCLCGLLVANWLYQAQNRRWFLQQDSEVTQEANLLSRTLASSSDRQEWLRFVHGLLKMNWGEVEILSDASLSDSSRQALVLSPTQWIQEPNDYYRVSVRQPIKDPTANTPSEWLLYSRRVRKPSQPWILQTLLSGFLGFLGGAAFAAVAWQNNRATAKLQDALQSIRFRVKRPVPRPEFLEMFPKSLSNDPVGSELIALCDQLHQNAYTHMSGSEVSDAILSAMPEGVLAFSSDLKLLFANRAAIQLLDLGSRIHDHVPLIELIRQPKILELVQDVQVKHQPLDCELESVDANDQQASLRIRAYSLSGEGRQYAQSSTSELTRTYASDSPDSTASVLLVISDETRVRQLENYRKDFTANVSHELKTPLAAIKAYSETLLMGALEDPDIRFRFVTSIGEQANKLEQLIRGLMQLSRIQTMPEKLTLSPIHLGDVVSSVIKEHRTVAESNQIKIDDRIGMLPDSSEVVVLAEFDALRTILGNLLSNAIRYSKQGGQVTLTTEIQEDRISLLVIDQGVGIPASDLDRIFERFYTVDKARSRDSGGTGLGLAIVKHLTIAIGGNISVQSKLGVGSTFRLSLQRPDLV